MLRLVGAAVATDRQGRDLLLIGLAHGTHAPHNERYDFFNASAATLLRVRELMGRHRILQRGRNKIIRENEACGPRDRKALWPRSYHPMPMDPGSDLQFGFCPVFAGAFLAGANGSQEIETEDSRRVAVVKINLQGVVADRV